LLEERIKNGRLIKEGEDKYRGLLNELEGDDDMLVGTISKELL